MNISLSRLKSLKDSGIYIIAFAVLTVFAYMDYRYLDLEYLALTNGDEFMQYHSLLRMFEGIRYGNLEDLFRFDSYVYGFVWHCLNLAVVAPFHIMGDTQIAIFMPRFLNAIFAVSCLVVIYKIARLRLGYFHSYALVALVLSMAGFYKSGYAFKPDVFQALLLLVSAYFLVRDNLAFKRDFYLAIVAFALSVGVAKIQAVMFLPLIYIYIATIWLLAPSMRNLTLCIKRGILSTLAIIGVFIATNPYVLHPRGFGAWWGLFLHNMQSNASNHFSYVNVNAWDKITAVVDFYYLNIAVFALFVGFSAWFVWRFVREAWNTDGIARSEIVRNFGAFFAIIGASAISLAYLFIFVNKLWSNYFVSTIYLAVLAFVPLWARFGAKILPCVMLIAQVGGGHLSSFLRGSFHQI